MNDPRWRDATDEEMMRNRMSGDRYPEHICTVCEAPVFEFYEERGRKENLIICDECGHVIRWQCALLGHVAKTAKRLRREAKEAEVDS